MIRMSLAFGLVATSVAFASGQIAPRPTLSTVDRMEVPPAVHRAAVAHALDAATLLHLSISLAPANAEGLESFVQGVSDPASPSYRHFLTPAQVGTRFGVSDARIQAVTAYLKSQGMKVTLVAPNRLSILVDATAAQAEKAFDTTLAVFRQVPQRSTDRADFFAYTDAPRVPTSFASSIVDIGGLENSTRPVPRSITAAQTRGIYKSAALYSSGYTGTGRTLAISNFDGYRLSNVSPYYSYNSLPTPSGGVGSNIQVIVCGTASGTGTPQGEGDLDIQMVLGMAPLCTFKIYDGTDLVTVLTREVNDNLADIISESYGWNLSASQATSAHNLHLSMSAQGITYLAASGDSGTNLEPYSYPDYEPEVLQVGGTIATATSSNTRSTEVGWSGSGGGYSTNSASFNVLPSWQKGTGVPTNLNKRLVPDVALNAAGANNSAAYPFYFNGSLNTGSVGTSFASPVLTGLLGIAEQRLVALNYFGTGVKRFGRLQDLIYSQNGRSDVWYDVTSGSNGNLPNGTASTAHAGWDSVTGWGAINIDGFVAALTGTGGGTTPPPTSTTYYATGVSVYGSYGAYVSGSASSLNGDDGTYYTVNSSSISGYSYASTEATYALPAGTTSATVNLQANGPSGVTEILYAYDYATGNYDAVINSTLSGADKTFTATLSSNYFSSTGAATLIEWTYRSGSTRYTLKTDLLTIVK